MLHEAQILNHKQQSTNTYNKHIRPSTSHYIPRNLNNQIKTNHVISHSTLHILYSHIMAKLPRTPY